MVTFSHGDGSNILNKAKNVPRGVKLWTFVNESYANKRKYTYKNIYK